MRPERRHSLPKVKQEPQGSGSLDAGVFSVTAPSRRTSLGQLCPTQQLLIFAHPQHQPLAKSLLQIWGHVASWSVVGPFPPPHYHGGHRTSHHADPGCGDEVFSHQHLHPSPKPSPAHIPTILLLTVTYGC